LPEIRSEAVNHESNNFKAVLRNLQTEKCLFTDRAWQGKVLLLTAHFPTKI